MKMEIVENEVEGLISQCAMCEGDHGVALKGPWPFDSDTGRGLCLACFTEHYPKQNQKWRTQRAAWTREQSITTFHLGR